MKKTLLYILATFLFLGSAMAQTVRMGTEANYEPYNFINDTTGEVDGFDRDVGDMICALANLDCVWVINEWDSIIPNLVAGNYDTIIAGMSITDERDQVIDFTQDYLPPSASVFMGLNGTEVDLESAVIAAQTATIQASYVADSGATLVEYATADETVSAVKNGEADAVLADGEYLYPVIAESNGQYVNLGEVPLGGGLGIGVRESDTELKAKLNKALTTMKENGSLNFFIKKWFPGVTGY